MIGFHSGICKSIGGFGFGGFNCRDWFITAGLILLDGKEMQRERRRLKLDDVLVFYWEKNRLSSKKFGGSMEMSAEESCGRCSRDGSIHQGKKE